MHLRLIVFLGISMLGWAERRFDAAPVNQALQEAVGPKGVPGVVAMVATPDGVLYRGAFGEARAGRGMAVDSVFRIFSMTKPVTSVAAMQLVERGKLELDAPVERYLPQMAGLKVLTGYDASGKPVLEPARSQPTLRQLLSHSAGFGYGFWDEKLVRHPDKPNYLQAPLLFHPGERWQYGTNTDLMGKIVETVSGQNLEEYFRAHIFAPLGMKETAFLPAATVHERIVSRYDRQADGTWKEDPQPAPANVTPRGGAGLYGTAADYIRFLQMFLHGGEKVLSKKSVAEMRRNQIGANHVRLMKSTNQAFSRDFGFHLEAGDKFGLGFQINPVAYEGGRGKNSMAWAGAMNTFFWVDPENRICAVILMQTMPFFDEPAVRGLQAFERAVYRGLR
ncbi:MAG: beta-lactamase family protein [Acidobacteria bacterium]|nr:beta-lactamase family protein [Acidobacteriota bacterium]